MENNFYGFIYMTTNLIDGKKYIGMHTDFTDDYLGSGILLARAIKKHGKENFSREIIAYAETKEELGALEIYFIKINDAVNNDDFYNIHEGGYGGNTRAGWDEERWQEYSKLLSSLLSGEKHPRYGVTLTDETKAKISHSHKLYWQNISDEKREEFKNIMREAVKGEKNPNYGNKWSEEKKHQLSELRIANGKSKGELNGMFGKKGENAITGKKVYMYDENFNLVKTFNTVGLALEYLEVKSHGAFYKSIKNKTLYKGFYWSKDLI